MKNVFLIIDPKSHIRNQISVLSRHQRYAEELIAASNNSTLLAVLSLGYYGDVQLEKKNNIWLIYFPLNIKGIIANYKLFRLKLLELGFIRLLISGDPGLGAVIVFTLRKIFFKGSLIEIQVHADIGDKAWRRINLFNSLKYTLAGLTLRRADQIRCVSSMQAHKIFSRLPSIVSKTVVIPIASSLESQSVNLNLEIDRPFSIGFVGRIHEDRGINRFLEVIEQINLKRQDFTVVVVGSGPKSQEFLNALETRVGTHRILNYHEIEPQNMGQIWNQIGVLLSCPQAESFGRTLREAISFGVPIWISPTSGGLEFTETLKSEYFQILEPVLDAEKLAQQFMSLSKIKIDYDSANKIVSENSSFTRKLIDSWLKLAEIK